MSTSRVVQLSDPHFGIAHPQHDHNWDIIIDWLDEAQPELVVVSGDVLYSDPMDAADLGHARRQLDRIPCRWVIIPGNHDIGDCPSHPDAGKRVTAEWLGGWMDAFGADRFTHSFPGWTVLGINAQTLLSPELGDEQWQWLKAELATMPPEHALALFCHRPPFRELPNETEANQDALHPLIRDRLSACVAPHRLRLFASGHKHQYRAFGLGETMHVWAPSVSCVNKHPHVETWGIRTVGFVEYRLSQDGRVRHRLLGSDMLLRNENYLHTAR